MVLVLLGGYLGTRDHLFTLYLDHAGGLQAGDGVFLRGGRVGTVRQVDPYGRRVQIQLRIYRRHLDQLPADSLFLLHQDELRADRRSILVVPGEATQPIETRPAWL